MTEKRTDHGSLDVVLIDDHKLLSAAVAADLKEHGVTARAIDSASLPEFATAPAGDLPGVVVLDLDLGDDGDGGRVMSHQWIGALRQNGWRVLLLTGSESQGAIAAGITEGAAGVLFKTSSISDLIDAVRRVADGESLITRDERRNYSARHQSLSEREHDLAERLGRLTPRERAVLEELAEGRTAVEIAKHAYVKLVTVRGQIRSILLKLGVSSQLVAVSMLHESRSLRTQ